MDIKSAVIIKPVVIKKGNIRILNPGLKTQKPFTTEEFFKEDILYDTTDVYFLKGEYRRLLLVNRFNIVSQQSRTVAKYYSKDGTVTEKTSDRVTEVIGQDQFKTIFTALCSILDQELKIRSILALLTLRDKVSEPIDCKDNIKKLPFKMLKESCCQTDEMRIEAPRPKKRMRKPVSPYIIQDMSQDTGKKKQKKLIINVRKINHVNPDTNEKVLLSSEMRIAPYEEDQDSNRNNFDPLTNQNSLTDNEQQSQSTYNSSSSECKTNMLTSAMNIQLNKSAVEKRTESFVNVCNHNFTNNIQNSGSNDFDNSVRYFNDAGLEKRNDTGTNHENTILSNDYSPQKLTDLGPLHDDLSNDSIGKYSSLSDTPTNPELLTNPMSLLNNVDQHTKEYAIETYKVQPSYRVLGTDIMVPFKPESMFHLATKDNLRSVDMATKKKLLQHQFAIDYEQCLNPDEDGNLPIHLAVMNDDMELLMRHCIVLKMKGSSVDIPNDGMTPLKLSVALSRGAAAACLVRHGACPLRTDAAHRACAHDAAERGPDVLRSVLAAARTNARKILYENEDLWKPEMETQKDEELAQYLLRYMCSMFTKQGYNPLMLACSLGLYENVRILLENCSNVNDKMPTSGNTAFYIAASAACNSTAETGNKSKINDNYRKTIEVLLIHDADPTIENNCGINVHTLLQESNNTELSMLVANKHKIKLNQLVNKKVPIPVERDIAKVMLVLGKGGDIQCKALENERTKKTSEKKTKTVKNSIDKPDKKATEDVKVKKETDKKANENVKGKMSTKSKLIVLDNVVLKPGNTEAGKIKEEKKSPNNKVALNEKNQGLKRKQAAGPSGNKQAKIEK